MGRVSRSWTSFAVLAIIAGSLWVTLAGRIPGAAAGGTTVVVQTMDSCKQILGSAEFSLTGGGVSLTATTPSGHGSVSGGSGGCPVEQGSCSAGPCATFSGVPDGAYRLITTRTPPANTANPAGYAPCEGGSACRSQIATVTVSGGSASATVTNTYPDGTTSSFTFPGTSSDPILFHDFGLAPPGSSTNVECDGDGDADDWLTGSPSSHCNYPNSEASSACQPFPWSCTLDPASPAPDPGQPKRQLSIGVPTQVAAFAPTTVTVSAISGGATDPTYTGTVRLSSSTDPLAELPAAYTFTAADDGSHTFTVVLRHPGLQSLTATDSSKSGASKDTATVTVTAGDASFVEDLYHDILGRLGTDPEVAYWTGRIAAGEPRQQVATFFSTSPEVEAREVTAAYQTLLGHAPDPGGLAYWTSQLASGGDDESLLAALAATPAYDAGHGKGTDSGFVTALYTDLLGRAPSASELASWLAGGAITDRAAMAHAFAFSHEHHLRVVSNATTGWYQVYLGRPADPAGAQYWATQLDGGVHDEVGVATFTSSAEYYAKPVTY